MAAATAAIDTSTALATSSAAVRQLRGELDEVESLLRRHGELEESENPYQALLRGLSGIQSEQTEAPLPEQAAEFTTAVLRVALENHGGMSLKLRVLLDIMSEDLRAKYNADDAVAVEALRAQLRSRQKKFDFIYHNGLVQLKSRPSLPNSANPFLPPIPTPNEKETEIAKSSQRDARGQLGGPVLALTSWPVFTIPAGVVLVLVGLLYQEALKKWVVHPALGWIERVAKPLARVRPPTPRVIDFDDLSSAGKSAEEAGQTTFAAKFLSKSPKPKSFRGELLQFSHDLKALLKQYQGSLSVDSLVSPEITAQTSQRIIATKRRVNKILGANPFSKFSELPITVQRVARLADEFETAALRIPDDIRPSVFEDS